MILKSENLVKIYGRRKVVKGVSLEVNQGEIVGLLGPNGAGKTTTINILTDLVRKTSGTVKVFGVDIDEDFSAAKKLI